ncbi:MAG: RNA methyltransferase [Bacteroidales bacterium]|nr:RNA methyltransferase [Bacteroidales bacterium]MCF8338023.1 RNA methyltransferase [Bacteroidales bacterium]
MRKLENRELNRLSVEEFKKIPKNPVVIVLENIRSANNVGSVFRTSDAFLAASIHLCGITPHPPNRDIQKTAIGATQTVSWAYFSSAHESLKTLREEGYHLFAIEQCEESRSLNNFQAEPPQKIALIFGNEVSGVSQEIVDMCDGCLEIPQWGTKHSLNISVSVGVVLWEYIRRASQRAKK